MNSTTHSLSTLFKQLGLEHSPEGIAKFVEKNKPLESSTRLHEASFWNESQSAFLKEAKALDADWAEIVDELDASLR
ncbi:MAG: DUF2789 domain-containing protein [Pseudohongiellaceae bacterium]|nr:DUF2789 domain-containing protein [Pseudohongiellaceae bacterium]